VNCYLPCFQLRLICQLLPAGYCCTLYLFKVHLGGAATSTLSGRLCLFKVRTGVCPSTLLQWRVLQASCSCRLYLFKVHQEDFPSPLLWCTQCAPALCYMSFSFPCLLFSFCFFFHLFPRVGARLSRGICWLYPRGGFGGILCHLFAHLLVYISQAH
jgi:hypothetical protein